MKNSDVFKNVDKKEVREAIADSLHHIYPSPEHIEKEIARLQEELEKSKKVKEKIESLKPVAEALNWKEYDISDYIDNYSFGISPNFIGTEEEFKKLAKEHNINENIQGCPVFKHTFY